jgi:hypothetical protein
VFDFVNLTSNDDSSECSNFISISSEKKPNDAYRLCGNRQGVKLITTYNNVVINFVTNTGLSNFMSTFSLFFKIISDPSALIPATTNRPLLTGSISPRQGKIC